MTATAQKPKRILKLPAVVERTGYSRSHIYTLEAQGLFPKKIKLGARSIGFLEHEIDEWIDSRVAASRQEAA